MSILRRFSSLLVCVVLFSALPLWSAALPIRGTLPWHNFLSGPTAWDEDDYERYLDRMKELGLNYIAFHCYTGGAERYAPYVEPLIRIQYRDVVPEAALDTSLTARWGYRPLGIPDFAFGTDKLFPRPKGAKAFGARCAVTAGNNAQRYEFAQRQMQHVIRMAHDRGIQVAIGFEFGIHPLEFWSVAPPGSYIPGAGIPDPTHPASVEILHNTLDDLFRTYSELDWIWLWLHEHTMFVGKPSYSPALKALLERDGARFKDAGGEAGTFTGVWSMAYVQEAYRYVKAKSPRTRLAISGWGGGNQLTGVLLGLDQVLPKDIVFTCLNPGLGTGAHPLFMGEIGKNREVWTIPWLEGDDALWHMQPRVSMMLEQVKKAQEQQLHGVLGIHWRTEETRANLEAFALAASDPEGAPAMEAFYQNYCEREYGKAAAQQIAPILIHLDKSQSRFASPEFYSYEPGWGRMTEALRSQWSRDLAAIRATATAESSGSKVQRANVEALAASFQFTLLLDEVGRRLEPAYLLKKESLLGNVSSAEMTSRVTQARADLETEPVEALLRTYASRARSRGELGVLSSLNQRVWLQYRELHEFLDQSAGAMR